MPALVGGTISEPAVAFRFYLARLVSHSAGMHAMDVRKYTLNYELASDNQPEFDVTCET